MFSSRRDGPSAIEKDFLVRQIKQLLEALVKKVAAHAVDAQQSQDDLRSICRELLDIEYDVVSRLNVPSIAMLLRSPERLEAFALVMETQAQQLRAQGNVAAANVLEARSRSLQQDIQLLD